MPEGSCEILLKSGMSLWMTALIVAGFHRYASRTQPPGLLGRDRLHPKVRVCVQACMCVCVLAFVFKCKSVTSHPHWAEIRGSPEGAWSLEESGESD